jgi:LPXTG-motif cell wall-anchored protein
MSSKLRLKYADRAMIAPYAGALGCPDAACDRVLVVDTTLASNCEKALVDAGLIVRKRGPWKYDSSMADTSYAWSPLYGGLTQAQRVALHVLCVGEALQAIPVGSAQRAINQLVAALPPMSVDAAGKPVVDAAGKSIVDASGQVVSSPGGGAFPWLIVIGGVVAAGGVYYYAKRKKRH